MRYLLDTDICSYIIKKRPAVLRHFERTQQREVAISAVTAAELFYGAARASGAQYQEAVRIFTRYITVLDWPKSAVEHYGALRARLEEKGAVIGEMDMMIAAHALAIKCVLVTNNTRHFARIEDLILENWR